LIDRLEALLDEEGRPGPEIAALIDHLASLPMCSKIPAFILSRRIPNFHLPLATKVGLVKVGGLRPEHTVTILENEARRIDPSKIFEAAGLRSLAAQLFGYPLAGRLAAPLLIKHSPEYLLENLSHITSLRRDIAEAILTHASFTEDQTRVLRVLALSAAPLGVRDIVELTQRDDESISHDIDILAEHNVVEPVGAAVALHPLVSDFYWKQARSAPDFKLTIDRIADYARKRLQSAKSDSQDLVHWLVIACRSLFLCGRSEEARRLRRDLNGELKVAAIELYQRQEYDLSLKYCEEYLASDSSDFDVSLHRARNLYRLGRAEEALASLDDMVKKYASPVRLARIHVARGRAFMEGREFEPAKEAFSAAFSAVPDWQPALQGMAELMSKMGRSEDAFGFLELGLKISPMDPFALSLKADLLWRRGQQRQAIETMRPVIRAQPDNATFLFRIGRFLHQSGNNSEAYQYFRRAKLSDPTYLDVRMSLASVAIDLGYLDEARKEIEDLRGKGSAEKRYVLDGIEAQFCLAKGDIDRASQLATRALAHRRSPTTLGMMAKIEVTRFEKTLATGMSTLADTMRTAAMALIEEGLKIESKNIALLHLASRVGMPTAPALGKEDATEVNLTPAADLEPELPASDTGEPH
jgi:tetratricopeptide (TPR) repeat protein